MFGIYGTSLLNGLISCLCSSREGRGGFFPLHVSQRRGFKLSVVSVASFRTSQYPQL
jgi:hypothetical protein